MTELLNDLEFSLNNIGFGVNYSKITVIIIMCIISSLLVLISHFTLYKIFKKDLLKIGGKIKWIHFLWCLGTITTYLILYFLNLISYTLQSIIVVAFTWNFLLERTFNRLIEEQPKDINNTIDEIIYLENDDFNLEIE